MKKFVRNMVVMASLVTVVAYAKQMQRSQQIVPAVVSTPVEIAEGAPGEWVQPSFAKASEDRPDIAKLPVPMNAPGTWAQPDITTLPAPMNAAAPQPKINPEAYAQNKVAALSQQLISDIFPKEETIERIVFEFKDQFPGPNKEMDMAMLYNAIMYNPEIRKFVTIKNAVPVYNFVTEALSKAWDKKDNLVWAS